MGIMLTVLLGAAIALSYTYHVGTLATELESRNSGSIIIVPRSAGVGGSAAIRDLAPAGDLTLLVSSFHSLRYRDSLVYSARQYFCVSRNSMHWSLTSFAVVVVWVLFACTLVSFVLAALTSRHIHKYGPEFAIGAEGRGRGCEDGLYGKEGEEEKTFSGPDSSMT